MGASTRMGRVLRGALWVLTVFETLTIGGAGTAKFRSDVWVHMFEGWGYPTTFTYVVGTAEIVGALLLLVPRATSWAASGLIVIMLGALGTLTTTDFATGLGVKAPLAHLLFLAVLLRGRWPGRWRPGVNS
jgi:putative oxidoreductase